MYPLLLIPDANGLVWPVDPGTGIRYGQTPIVEPIYYAGSGCTGSRYVLASDVLPEFVFTAWSPGTELAVVPPGTATAMPTIQSEQVSVSVCQSISIFNVPMYPYTPVAAADLPSQFFTPPAKPVYVP